MTKHLKATFWTVMALSSLVTGIVVCLKQWPTHFNLQLDFIKHSISTARPIVPQKLTAKTSPLDPTETVVTTTSTTVLTAPTSIPVATRKASGQKTEPTPVIVPSYGKVVTEFNGLRFQFNSSCMASPAHLAISNPVTIMLDNRSDSWQDITVGQNSYNVAPYNYVITTVSETRLPMDVYISCNQQMNTAVILLQK